MAGETERRDQETPAEASDSSMPPACKSRLMSWRLVGAVLAFLVVLGWIFIIVVLILKEKWQLVLVAWLLLYSAAHFCYWYCKRHSLLTLHRQIRLRVLTNVRPGESGGKVEDHPPTYDEVINTEAPPPAYFTVMSETWKPVAPSSGASSDASSDHPQIYVTPISGWIQQGNGAVAKELMELPPAYQTPKHLRKISPRILPTVHESRVPTDTAVTATAAAAAAAVATVAQVNSLRDSTLEDPIRGPIVRHLRSTTIATLDVSSSEEVSPEPSTSSSSVTSDVRDQRDSDLDLQAPSSVHSFP